MALAHSLSMRTISATFVLSQLTNSYIDQKGLEKSYSIFGFDTFYTNQATQCLLR